VRNRFAQRRLDGLYDEPRPGAPRSIGDDEVASTIRKTLETRPSGSTHWSLRTKGRAAHPRLQAERNDVAVRGARREGRDRHRPMHAPAPRQRVPQIPRRGRAQRALRPRRSRRHGQLRNAQDQNLIRNWFAKRPRWHVHFTPTSASWINQVERFFPLLAERALERGVFCSVRDLEQAIKACIDATNADPKPFRWTKTADDILASIQRCCLRTLEAEA
jgi:transposase